MVFTLLCAALTVILFIVGNVSEGHWKWDEPTYLEYTSAVQTGELPCSHTLSRQVSVLIHSFLQAVCNHFVQLPD